MFLLLAVLLWLRQGAISCNIDGQEASNQSLFIELERHFYKACPLALSPNLPLEALVENNFTEPLVVDFSLSVYRLMEINDLEKRMSVFAQGAFSWYYPCKAFICSSRESEHVVLRPFCGTKRQGDIFLYQNRDYQVWHPVITQMNAFEEVMPFEVANAQSVYLVYPFDSGNGYPSVSFFVTSVISTKCTSFSFKNFPFDTLNCAMIFTPDYEPELLKVNIKTFSVEVNEGEPFVADSEIWQLATPANQNESFKFYTDLATESGVKYARLHFEIRFCRKYNYYVNNIIIPTVGIFVMQIACLVMPADAPDRAAFAMAAVLANSVNLGLVFANIPQTTESVNLISIVIAKFICGLGITVYTLITLPISQWPIAERTVLQCGKAPNLVCKISVMRFADLVFGTSITLIVFIVDIIYFSLMTQ